ncbi:MAG: response regulator transcription factor [Halieaceae bacterium]|jgi:two-component system, OmpR family, response regulator PhoP|nr:response regulator transcription factor [Halieaceae bacterium]
MRMLIVEDEDRLRQQLTGHFSAAGWVVEEAADGSEALYMGSEYPYDIAIVDLGLPHVSGIELIRDWRAQKQAFPILILTARSDWQDKVEGLEAGADDYVTKPFHLEEVQARINALQRRAAGRSRALADYGVISIDFSSRQVLREGEPLTLTTFEYNTLEYLVHRAGSVVSKTELTEHLYDQDFDRDSNVIEVFIGRLRKKLDPDNEINPIKTVRGAGYCFAMEAKTE